MKPKPLSVSRLIVPSIPLTHSLQILLKKILIFHGKDRPNLEITVIRLFLHQSTTSESRAFQTSDVKPWTPNPDHSGQTNNYDAFLNCQHCYSKPVIQNLLFKTCYSGALHTHPVNGFGPGKPRTPKNKSTLYQHMPGRHHHKHSNLGGILDE